MITEISAIMPSSGNAKGRPEDKAPQDIPGLFIAILSGFREGQLLASQDESVQDESEKGMMTGSVISQAFIEITATADGASCLEIDLTETVTDENEVTGIKVVPEQSLMVPEIDLLKTVMDENEVIGSKVVPEQSLMVPEIDLLKTVTDENEVIGSKVASEQSVMAPGINHSKTVTIENKVISSKAAQVTTNETSCSEVPKQSAVANQFAGLTDQIEKGTLPPKASERARETVRQLIQDKAENYLDKGDSPARAALQTNAVQFSRLNPVRAAVLEQVLEQMVFNKQLSGESSVTVRLKPSVLGEVEIRLSLEDGLLTGKIFTNNIQVKEVLEAALGQLRQRLEMQNIQLAELTVTVDHGDSFQHGQRSSYHRDDTNVGTVPEAAVAVDNIDAAQILPGLLDVLV